MSAGNTSPEWFPKNMENFHVWNGTVKFTLWTSKELMLPQKSSATRPQMCQGVLQFWLLIIRMSRSLFITNTSQITWSFPIFGAELTCDWIAFWKSFSTTSHSKTIRFPPKKSKRLSTWAAFCWAKDWRVVDLGVSPTKTGACFVA